jgi:DNA-directed RNA polymerase specialized sigma24 family protein
MIHVMEAVLEGCVNSKMMAAPVDDRFGQLRKDPSKAPEEEQPDRFDAWFSRCRNTLHFMANLILNSPELAEHAVQKCRQKALGNPPKFENEGEFNGWIFRLLIDEALVIRSRRYKAFWG